MTRDFLTKFAPVPADAWPEAVLDQPVDKWAQGRYAGRTWRDLLRTPEDQGYLRWKARKEWKENNEDTNWRCWTSKYRETGVFCLWLLQGRERWGFPA